ncbi:alpha/beta hydrolase [Acuticoccus sediminis]|uniref:Alpha/beta hydrolase n=1 Tax=Acuticoccus sediminis TaxID=2184697 RepID=A0A8B2NUH9_9HYPH|nr:alpha/beta hydrolase [Acuticoccus sediminis]RAI02159.1 alpha/beta hydrolase [Acuticoccus sediminis]
MTTFDVATPDGAILKARREGSGAPLLLISGLGGTAAFWNGTVEALKDVAEVITFDQRGIGGSSRGTVPVTIAQLADDVAALLDTAEIATATVVGHSTGGAIAQSLAIRHKVHVGALGLSGTWLAPNRYMSALFAARLSMLAQDPAIYASTAALFAYPPEWLETHFEVHEAAVAKAPRDPAAQAVVRERIDALLAFDGRADVERIAVPTRVIGAEDDAVVPAFLQRALAAALPGAGLAMLPGGGHFFPQTRGAEFTQIVRDLLAETA